MSGRIQSRNLNKNIKLELNLRRIRKILEIINSNEKLIIDIKGFVVIEVFSSLDKRELKGLIAAETGLFYRDYRIFRNGVLVSEDIFDRPDYLTVVPNYGSIDAYDNDACGSFSDHKSDEIENEKEVKELNVSIEKQAEIEKVAQKEEETKKSHKMFITDSFKLACKKFEKMRLERQKIKGFPYTKCTLSRDLRKLSLYNELNEKQVLESLLNLRKLCRNPFDAPFFETLKYEFLEDIKLIKYTVNDNLECPLKYYLQSEIVG